MKYIKWWIKFSLLQVKQHSFKANKIQGILFSNIFREGNSVKKSKEIIIKIQDSELGYGQIQRGWWQAIE
jgi:hypothetical protein